MASLSGEVEGRPDVISCAAAATVGDAAGERMVRSGCPSSSADGGVAGLTREGEEGRSGRLLEGEPAVVFETEVQAEALVGASDADPSLIVNDE